MTLEQIINGMRDLGALTVAELDAELEKNKADIIQACTVLPLINGVKLRVATAIVFVSEDLKSAYLYRRTGEGEARRGIPENYDTPKGRVPFTGKGKWNVDEGEVSGEIVGVGLATEYQPAGKFQEYVHRPVVVIQVDASSQFLLTDKQHDVPQEMGDVKQYEWVDIDTLSHENAMTKVLAAIPVVKAAFAAQM